MPQKLKPLPPSGVGALGAVNKGMSVGALDVHDTRACRLIYKFGASCNCQESESASSDYARSHLLHRHGRNTIYRLKPHHATQLVMDLHL